MKLYEISKALNKMSADMEDSDLDEQTISDTLSGSTELATFEDKAAACIAVMKNMDSDVEQIDAEIKRLQDLKKFRKNNVDRLKSYLLSCMQSAELQEVKAGTLTLKRQKNPSSVVVYNVENLPNEYVKTTIVTEANKTAIKAALKAGTDVVGCRLVAGERLVIK